MRVRDWQDIVEEVVEKDVDPDQWRAVAGDRSGGIGEDMVLGHPRGGVYLLKTYARNPFEVEGVGTRIARNLDDEIGSYLPETDQGRFAVQRPPENESEAETMATRIEEVVRAHADAPTKPADLFDDVMEAMESPAFGPMEYDQYDRPDGLDALTTTFEDAQDVLETEFEEVVEEAGVEKGFH